MYAYLGSDEPDTVDSGRTNNNEFIGNTISGGAETIKLQESDDIIFTDNAFTDPDTIRFDDSTMMLMTGNTGLEDAQLKIQNGACFDPESDDDMFVPTC